MLKSIAVSLLGFALLAPSATRGFAQDVSAKQFTMQQIVFKGTRHFTDGQLLIAIGMKIGGVYSQQDLVDAANKLANSGMFSQVSYRFSPTSAEFNLSDSPNLLPVRLDNCVWMTNDDMMAQLKKRVPLFRGQVAEQSVLTDSLVAEIEAVLAERGVRAKVQYMPSLESGSVKALTYTVIDPRIEIATVRFVGASPAIAKSLEEASKSIVGKEYTSTLLASAGDGVLKNVLQENGYLQGRFGAASTKLVSAAADPIAKLELIVPVEEGSQYRIASLVMKGDDPVALEAAKRLAAFKTGDIANMSAFRKELSRLGGAYLAAGYMNAKVRAEPTFDETAHTVKFEIELVPGEVYKLSKLDLQGLDEKQKAKLLPLWKLNPGDTYDPTYAPTFLKRNQSKLEFLNGYSLAWTQRINDDTRTVELLVFFRKPGTAVQ